MNVAKFAEPFLTRASITLLLSRLRSAPRVIQVTQLRADFHALHPGGRTQFEATIQLIEKSGLVTKKDDDTILIDQSCFTPSVGETVDCFARKLIYWLSNEGHMVEFVQALQFDEHNHSLLLDTLRVPWRLNHLRHLLRELGVFSRDDVNLRHWKVSPQYFEDFFDAAKSHNLIQRKAPLSPDDRLRLQEHLDFLGEEAEKWFLLREKQRLSDHPLVALVRRVSESDVAAGYDIISFESTKSLVHDRFLEIKSYSDRCRFFWSNGEIEQARELGDRYVMVLVDRQKVSDPGYKPIEILDPYNFYFSDALNGWTIKPTELLIERI